MTNSTQDPLELYGHEIIAVSRFHGSVLLWRCRTCGTTAEDASEYLDVSCKEPLAA